MCQFVETIRIVHGRPQRLAFHEERMNRTRREVFRQGQPTFLSAPIQEHLCSLAGSAPSDDIPLKLRIVYGREGIVRISAEPYVMRSIKTLRLVCCDDIAYPHKSTDRQAINRLFAQRGQTDDIIIVRHGLLTDTSFTNIALYDGCRWLTPRHPLLCGIMRAALLRQGIIEEGDITVESLSDYTQVTLFNAMIDFGQLSVSTSAVFPPISPNNI